VLSHSGLEYAELMNNKLCPLKLGVSVSAYSWVQIQCWSFHYALTPDDVNTGTYLQRRSRGDGWISFTDSTSNLCRMKPPCRNARAAGRADECWQVRILRCWQTVCASCRRKTFGGSQQIEEDITAAGHWRGKEYNFEIRFFLFCFLQQYCERWF